MRRTDGKLPIKDLLKPKSVKDMTDQQLNIAIEVLLGAEEDRHRPGLVLKGGLSKYPKQYSKDPAASIEVQAIAIESDRIGYCDNLDYIVNPNKGLTIGEHFIYDAFVCLLTATPRQRAEAAYITLSQARD